MERETTLSTHHDLRDVAPLAGALGVVGVDGAVFPLGGGGGHAGGVDVVGAGIDGEEGPLAGAAFFLDLDAFLAAFVPEDFDLAAAGVGGNSGARVAGSGSTESGPMMVPKVSV
jgi:hypothetical protein